MLFLNQTVAVMADKLSARQDAVEQGPRKDAAPGEVFAVLVNDGTRELRDMRWSMVMSGRVNARGRPVMETIVNARSETVFGKSAFSGVRRAVVPVSGWYEWTGSRGRKSRWQIDDPNQPLLLFAAIYDVWQGPSGVEVAQMATLTCAPNADVGPIHHRMPVMLRTNQIDQWFAGDEGEASAMMQPWPEGRLRIAKADLS